jgi:Domain of unknown function (DUF6265)
METELLAAGTTTRIVCSLFALYFIPWFPRQQAQPASQSSLPAWMAGCWQARTATDTLEEYWSLPRGSQMLGLSVLVHGESLMTYEQNRIVLRGSQIVLISQERAESAKEYIATDVSKNLAVFDLAETRSERIRYRRSGDTLRVRFARRFDGADHGVEDKLTRINC